MERIVRANGVDLCVQTFGDSAAPPILLVMGGASSMDWREEGFCGRLMAGSRFVIRYDPHDTGRSISHEPGDALSPGVIERIDVRDADPESAAQWLPKEASVEQRELSRGRTPSRSSRAARRALAWSTSSTSPPSR